MENQGLNSSQGWEEEKTKGRIIDKGGKKRKPRAGYKNKGGSSNTSPNNNPGGCIRQARVPKHWAQIKSLMHDCSAAFKNFGWLNRSSVLLKYFLWIHFISIAKKVYIKLTIMGILAMRFNFQVRMAILTSGHCRY